LSLFSNLKNGTFYRYFLISIPCHVFLQLRDKLSSIYIIKNVTGDAYQRLIPAPDLRVINLLRMSRFS